MNGYIRKIDYISENMRNNCFSIARGAGNAAISARMSHKALVLFENIQGRVASGKSDMFAVYQDGRIASFIIGDPISSGSLRKKLIYDIDWLCSHKNYRANGFEARLLWHFITHAAKQGAASVVLKPDDKKPWESDYYKLFGFKNIVRSDKMVKTL